MTMNPPTEVVWWISLLVGLVSFLLLSGYVTIKGVPTDWGVWGLGGSLVLMLLATRVRHL